MQPTPHDTYDDTSVAITKIKIKMILVIIIQKLLDMNAWLKVSHDSLVGMAVSKRNMFYYYFMHC